MVENVFASYNRPLRIPKAIYTKCIGHLDCVKREIDHTNPQLPYKNTSSSPNCYNSYFCTKKCN